MVISAGCPALSLFSLKCDLCWSTCARQALVLLLTDLEHAAAAYAAVTISGVTL